MNEQTVTKLNLALPYDFSDIEEGSQEYIDTCVKMTTILLGCILKRLHETGIRPAEAQFVIDLAEVIDAKEPDIEVSEEFMKKLKEQFFLTEFPTRLVRAVTTMADYLERV